MYDLTFPNNSTVNRWFVPEGEVSEVRDSNNIILWKNQIDWYYKYFNISKINSAQSDLYVKLINNNYSGTDINIQYKTESHENDDINYPWQSATWGTYSGIREARLTLTNDPIVLKGYNAYSPSIYGLNIQVYSDSNYQTQAEFQVSGALASLINNTAHFFLSSIVDNCFRGLFSNSSVKYTHNLILPPVTSNSSHRNMFSNCVNLVTIPTFTTTGTIPVVPLSVRCYQDMFSGCTALTTVSSNLLPATTLVQGCYSGMFFNCTSLTTAPALPATTLAYGCYSGMFNGCSALNNITCLATAPYNSGTGYPTEFWVSGVSNTGTFTLSSNTNYFKINPNTGDYFRGNSYIPTGWTVNSI